MTLESSLLSCNDARALLAPLHDQFAAAHTSAWDAWLRLQKLCLDHDGSDLMLPLTPTTRANFVNNHCVHNIDVNITKTSTVTPSRVGQLFTTVLVSDGNKAALIRFKYLNQGLSPSNVRTNVQRSLSKQEWPENLFADLGIPTIPTVLTCGYRLSPDETAISSIHICCHYGKELLWQYEIDQAGEAGGSLEITPLPIPDLPSPRPRIVSTMVPEKETALGEGEE